MASLKQTLLVASSPSYSPKVNIMKFLLSDSSINKATFDNSLAERMTEKAKIKQFVLGNQKAIRIISQKQRLVQENWEHSIKLQLQLHSQKRETCENAAITIQKIVRGFLVRLKIEPVLLIQRESTTKSNLTTLRLQTDYCMLTLGTTTIPAVKTIQSAYRRYLFRKKLETLHVAYKLYLKQREEIICDYLRGVLWGFSCRTKKNIREFWRYRVKRMEEIKRNLAILRFKKVWKGMKMTVRVLREKFIRIKRRKLAIQNREAYQKYLATMGTLGGAKKENANKRLDASSRESNVDLEDKEDGQQEDEEFKEAQRIKEIIEQKIKEKVAKSKLAYAVEENTVKERLPMMQEKALNESLDVEALKSTLNQFTVSVFAKGRSLTRSSPETTRNFQLHSPRAVSQRRHYDGLGLPPLSIISPAEAPIEFRLMSAVRPVEGQHFLNSTQSSINKTGSPIIPAWKQRELDRIELKYQKKKMIKLLKKTKPMEGKRITKEIVIKEKKAPWVPVARRFSSYISGIDNSGYECTKWSPLPLNKRILNSALATISPRNIRHSVPTSSIPMDSEQGFYYDHMHKFFSHPKNSGSISTQEQSVD